MCGITGIVNCGDKDVLARMTSVQAHRGPDDSGLWEKRFADGSYVGLGSRRLAIIDLSPGGHMPMRNEDATVWITYNGEIYNFAELRRELIGKGHRFASDTDTEVIVHLYEEEGPDCVKRLNGMFAFAICDFRSGEPIVFVARDHFGVKPFYYSHQGRRFAFAALVVVGDQKGRVGYGAGKAREVPEAIRKATERAKRGMIRVPMKEGRTLHHDVEGQFGAGNVILRSAAAGTGIIAGGPLRAVFETLGIGDVVAKSLGSRNPHNMVKAAFAALQKCASPSVSSSKPWIKPWIAPVKRLICGAKQLSKTAAMCPLPSLWQSIKSILISRAGFGR